MTKYNYMTLTNSTKVVKIVLQKLHAKQEIYQFADFYDKIYIHYEKYTLFTD